MDKRPKKILKRVKLIRNFSREIKEDSEERTKLATIRRQKWGTSDWLNKLSSYLYKVDVESIKIVCPSLEFLNENEVHLESTPREKKNLKEKYPLITNQKIQIGLSMRSKRLRIRQVK
ncbi:hypothetical protein NQ314_013523 [Rhamnusium bicolor]|uniref:Uncharacterized protein n=1 Tax=Rhamnusium bicolor TaxID=1586634 RepID=A0AAV8X608_9CUCU|nr:hypothetical protein NQ314_013523 [Rhamnusium bicolor]